MNIFEMKDLCYGGDYNPEQWKDYEGIWDDDIRLMKEASINCVSLGIFAWVSIEKEEGKYDFSWMDKIIDKLTSNGIKVILATPSGARPAWLAQKYSEVLRVRENGIRESFGRRHNHCLTSPVYRKKVAMIDEELSKRYGKHPGVIMWHISNEFGGECFCDICRNKFRDWLREKYHNSLDELNHAWWNAFWSHTYTDWSQVDAPTSYGEKIVHGQNLDWRRFVSEQTVDFYRNEVEAVRKHSDLPVTANFMDFEGLDYHDFAKYVDFVTWDNYPRWHNDYESMLDTANYAGYMHDMFRSMKQKPFLMIESTPSLVNWHDVNKIKAPVVNLLASMQAVAHGSDGVMYFQIRKSRGASEKFHGAVIDHVGTNKTRVFKEVSELGKLLAENPQIKGSYTDSDVAVVFDYENEWVLGDIQGLKKGKKSAKAICMEHYGALRKYGVNVDVISPDADFSKYKVITAPVLYMLKEENAEKIREFIKNGGKFVGTYLLSYVNETDLCYLGGFPGNLMDVFGIWNEEIDTIYATNAVVSDGKEYTVNDYCEIIHPDDDTEILGTYKSDFYAGSAAVTKKNYGDGEAYYIAAKTERDYLEMLYSKILSDANITPLLDEKDNDISVTKRGDNIFIMNFSDGERKAKLNGEEIVLKPYEVVIK